MVCVPTIHNAVYVRDPSVAFSIILFTSFRSFILSVHDIIVSAGSSFAIMQSNDKWHNLYLLLSPDAFAARTFPCTENKIFNFLFPLFFRLHQRRKVSGKTIFNKNTCHCVQVNRIFRLNWNNEKNADVHLKKIYFSSEKLYDSLNWILFFQFYAFYRFTSDQNHIRWALICKNEYIRN